MQTRKRRPDKPGNVVNTRNRQNLIRELVFLGMCYGQFLVILAATVAVLRPVLTDYYTYRHFHIVEMLLLFSCGFSYCLLLVVPIIRKRTIKKSLTDAADTQTIFLSYTKNDSSLALKIADELNSYFSQIDDCGLQVKTRKDIPYGVDIATGIGRNIEESSIIIALVTEFYAKNTHWQNEYRDFVSSKKRVVPIVVDTTERVCESFLPELSHIEYLLLDKRILSDANKSSEYLGHRLYLLANQLSTEYTQSLDDMPSSTEYC